MAAKDLTMMQSALQRLRVSRHGPMTMLVVDGQGAAVCLTADFSPVEKWAKAKAAAPNGFMSMQKVVEKVEVCVARPGTTFASTRGSTKPLSDLVKTMKNNGFDINEWAIPPDVKNPPPDLAEQKRLADEKKARDAEIEKKNKAALERLELARRHSDPEQGKT